MARKYTVTCRCGWVGDEFASRDAAANAAANHHLKSDCNRVAQVTKGQRPPDAPPEHCDTCGENDGTIERVVLVVGRHVKFKRWLCRSCAYTSIVTVAAPSRRPQ